MKNSFKTLLILAICLTIISCSKDNPTTATLEPDFQLMVEHTPKNIHLIDIKTKILNKINATGTKNGAKAYLNKQEWCKVVETGEEYSLWIKDLSRDTSAFPTINVSFTLELQEPSAGLEHDPPYKKKNMVITYISDKSLETTGTVEQKLILDRYRQYAANAKLAGTITAFVNNHFIKNSPSPYTKIGSEVIDLFLSYITDEEKWKFAEVEAVICGAEVCGQLKEWLWEREQ